MRKNQVVQLTMAAVLLGMTAVIGGCSGGNKADDPPIEHAEQTGVKLIPATPQTTDRLLEQVPSKPTGTEPPDAANGGLQTASGNGTAGADNTPPAGKNVATSSDKSVPDSKTAQPPAVEAYSVKKPTLMGISLTDTITTVTQKLGKPTDDYSMDDEDDPILVYEYNGFLIGFNKVRNVQFVEITTNDVDPGLNGLKLGQNVKDAVQALGKPDTNNKYALSYKNGGTILKLDIDPTTQNILSIKLFAETK